jgi:hypothetical protein
VFLSALDIYGRRKVVAAESAICGRVEYRDNLSANRTVFLGADYHVTNGIDQSIPV